MSAFKLPVNVRHGAKYVRTTSESGEDVKIEGRKEDGERGSREGKEEERIILNVVR